MWRRKYSGRERNILAIILLFVTHHFTFPEQLHLMLIAQNTSEVLIVIISVWVFIPRRKGFLFCTGVQQSHKRKSNEAEEAIPPLSQNSIDYNAVQPQDTPFRAIFHQLLYYNHYQGMFCLSLPTHVSHSWMMALSRAHTLTIVWKSRTFWKMLSTLNGSTGNELTEGYKCIFKSENESRCLHHTADSFITSNNVGDK